MGEDLLARFEPERTWRRILLATGIAYYVLIKFGFGH